MPLNVLWFSGESSLLASWVLGALGFRWAFRFGDGGMHMGIRHWVHWAFGICGSASTDIAEKMLSSVTAETRVRLLAARAMAVDKAKQLLSNTTL